MIKTSQPMQLSGDTAGVVRSVGLRDQVYSIVRRTLQDGQLQPGVLLKEVELALKLGVSRTPVREALGLLEQDGILESTGRGYRIRELADSEISQIFAVRQLIEPSTFAATVLAMDADTRQRLVMLVEAQAAAADAAEFIEANAAFRQCWRQAIANLLIQDILERYDNHVQYLRIATLNDPVIRQLAAASLAELMNAVASGDGARIAKAKSDHLLMAETSLRSALKARTAAPQTAEQEIS
jgi:DNA-binding GntR family transcriptional regulator